LAYRKATFAQARELFKHAIDEDPEYAAAYGMAAWTLMSEQAVTGVPLTEEMRMDAVRLAQIGSALASDDALALARCGHVLTYLGYEYDRGRSMAEQAVVLNPNLAMAWYSLGWVALMCDEPARAIESFDGTAVHSHIFVLTATTRAARRR
jgi:tetratricopeptide (TPR) repeat protein